MRDGESVFSLVLNLLIHLTHVVKRGSILISIFRGLGRVSLVHHIWVLVGGEPIPNCPLRLLGMEALGPKFFESLQTKIPG